MHYSCKAVPADDASESDPLDFCDDNPDTAHHDSMIDLEFFEAGSWYRSGPVQYVYGSHVHLIVQSQATFIVSRIRCCPFIFLGWGTIVTMNRKKRTTDSTDPMEMYQDHDHFLKQTFWKTPLCHEP